MSPPLQLVLELMQSEMSDPPMAMAAAQETGRAQTASISDVGSRLHRHISHRYDDVRLKKPPLMGEQHAAPASTVKPMANPSGIEHK